MRAYLSKAEEDFHCYCSHSSCENKNFRKEKHWQWKKRIPINSTILVLEMGTVTEIYCRECIDKLYRELKPILNSKLWVFS